MAEFRHADYLAQIWSAYHAGAAMSGEFDPTRHKIVAIVSDGPERGQHLHVTVQEFRQVVERIEREVPAELPASLVMDRARVEALEKHCMDLAQLVQVLAAELDQQKRLVAFVAEHGLAKANLKTG